MKEYLGDSVYAAIDTDGVVLTTENGIVATNTIYLENDVLDNLILFARNVAKYNCVEWQAEMSSGCEGYRHMETGEWVYKEELEKYRNT